MLELSYSLLDPRVYIPAFQLLSNNSPIQVAYQVTEFFLNKVLSLAIAIDFHGFNMKMV